VKSTPHPRPDNHGGHQALFQTISFHRDDPVAELAATSGHCAALGFKREFGSVSFLWIQIGNFFREKGLGSGLLTWNIWNFNLFSWNSLQIQYIWPQTIRKLDASINTTQVPVRYNRAFGLHTVGSGSREVSKWKVGFGSVKKNLKYLHGKICVKRFNKFWHIFVQHKHLGKIYIRF
jgi:hypothetical protein